MSMQNHAAGLVGQAGKLTYQRLVDAVFAVFVFSGFVATIEPSPYDFLAFLAFPVWMVGGFRMHRAQFAVILLLCALDIAGFAALIPHWTDTDARTYEFITLYLFVTAICFTLFFGERTVERAEVCLKAFTCGAVVSALIGILGYFGYAVVASPVLYERVAATFKDPNVFGSYLVLGVAYVLQNLLIGTSPRRIISLVSLAILLVGIFLSYSRGSWGATLLVFLMIASLTYRTSDNRATRRRIIIMSAVILAIVALLLLVVLSNSNIRQFFYQRAVLQQYDEGETGRFGNQLRSLSLLLEHPEGLGPLQFRLLFGLDPHNSYVGAFANHGWFGGFAWILLVLSTAYVGFRLIFARSPYRRLAQIVWPVLFALVLQAFQIDIDHWRQVYLLFGMVWGFEAARLRWLQREARLGGAPIRASETYG